ncbi:MAG TPA: hypothetical protein VMI12_01155 [Puia sp.]|nr:hypothetical protein [Puia sp.]
MNFVIKRFTYIFFFLFIALYARTQELTGIWRGHFRSNEIYQRLMGDDDRYRMEVQIAQQDKKFQAVTYSYKSTIFYGKADANGSIDLSTKKVLLKELKIVEVRMVAGDACIMTCYLQYSKLNDEEFLEGTYTSMNTRDSTDCGRGTIFLHKVPETDFYKEPFLEKREKEIESEKKKIAANPPPAAVKKNTTPTAETRKTVKSNTTASNATKKTTVVKPVAKSTTATVSTTKKTNTTPAKTTSSGPKSQKKTSTASTKKITVQKDMVKTDINTHEVVTMKKDSITTIEKKPFPTIVPRVLASRSNELVKSITVSTRDVELNIYDDGTIDNDTVSVYFDNKLIVSGARLTDQPIVVKLHLDENTDLHEVVMVAENMGDIPPNTSLMVVKAGEKRFEVRIVSTEQKNAVVQFKYEKPE